MGQLKVHGGDFLKSGGLFSSKGFSFYVEGKGVFPESVSIPPSDLEFVEIASEENVKKLGGKIGWGLAGAVLAGPVGLLAGVLGGGNKKEVTFVAKFRDGRKVLATTDSKTYTKILAASL